MSVSFSCVVVEYAILQIGFLQVGHVHERHAACIKGEQEHILCKVEGWLERQIQFLDSLYFLQCDCTFDGLVDACIDMPEWIMLNHKLLFDGTIIYGTEYAVVEGNGVLLHSVSP